MQDILSAENRIPPTPQEGKPLLLTDGPWKASALKEVKVQLYVSTIPNPFQTEKNTPFGGGKACYP